MACMFDPQAIPVHFTNPNSSIMLSVTSGGFYSVICMLACFHMNNHVLNFKTMSIQSRSLSKGVVPINHETYISFPLDRRSILSRICIYPEEKSLSFPSVLLAEATTSAPTGAAAWRSRSRGWRRTNRWWWQPTRAPTLTRSRDPRKSSSTSCPRCRFTLSPETRVESLPSDGVRNRLACRSTH